VKKLILVLALAVPLLIVAFWVMERPAFGGTRYIAQSAGTFRGGKACDGHRTITPATFNRLTNSPGDVNYICGTITVPVNTHYDRF
jgi:hypothetical protein